MTPEKLQDLARAVAKAVEAGKAAAAAAPNDDGTCNTDHVYLYGLKRMKEETLKAAGIKCRKWKPGQFHLDTPWPGQANRNCAGVQAMYKSLIADGVECAVYYMMD